MAEGGGSGGGGGGGGGGGAAGKVPVASRFAKRGSISLVRPPDGSGGDGTSGTLSSAHDAAMQEHVLRRGHRRSIHMTMAPSQVALAEARADAQTSIGRGTGRGAEADERADNSDGALNDAFNLAVLRELKKAFDAADDDGSGALDEEEFVEAISKVSALRASMADEGVNHLFMKIDANSDGTVDWDEFTNHILLEQMARSEDDVAGPEGRPYVKVTPVRKAVDPRAAEAPAGDGADKKPLDKLFDEPRLRRRVQAFMASIASTASKESGGSRGVRGADAFSAADTSLGHKGVGRGESKSRSQRGGANPEARDEHSEMIQRILWIPTLGSYISAGRDGILRQWEGATCRPQRWTQNGSAWITDIAHMAPQPLAVCAADRTISFYDAGRPSMDPLGRITQLDNVPMCATWLRVSENDMLLYGDDRGGVHTYTLADEWGSEGTGPNGIEVGKKVLSGMKAQTPYKAHAEWVTRIKYLSHSDALLTSSMDSTLQLTDFERRKVKWKVTDHLSGVYSFAFCRSYNFIASCGLERNVLLFNPFTGKSVGTLAGHSASVCDVIVNEADNQLISLSMDKVVKIWDIRSNKCMQTITDKTDYWPENRISAIAFNPQRKAIVTGATKLDSYQRKRRHEAIARPVSAALYNQPFSQVVSGDAGSVISVWNCVKGENVFSFNEAHGDAKVSAMTFDTTGRRLLTGGTDGTLYMWNFNNGSRLNEYVGFGSAEISCCLYIEDGPNRYVAAAGWNRKVCVWRDTGSYTEQVHHCMEGHEDDIICAIFCKPNVIATGSYDGKVMLWKIDGVLKQTLVPMDHEAHDMDDRPVTALLQLKQVAGGDLIVSGYADGAMRFYSLTSGALLVQVQTPHSKQSGGVSAMCTVEDNSRIYTADAAGVVACYEVDTELLSKKAFDALPSRSAGTSPVGKLKRGIGASPMTDLAAKLDAAATLEDESRASTAASAARAVPVRCMCRWQAHSERHSVVSMDAVEGGFLLTASNDGHIKLWTREGALVGAFGQTGGWELGEVGSWKSPLPKLIEESGATGEGGGKGGGEGGGGAGGEGEGGEGNEAGLDAGLSAAEEEAVDSKLLLQKQIAALSNRSRSHAKQAFAATLERRLPLQALGEVDSMLDGMRVRSSARKDEFKKANRTR